MNIKLIIKNTVLYRMLHAIWICLNQIPVRISGFFRSKGIFLNDNYKELLKYKNRHKGERCFLIANGPSLKPEDLELLKDEICFGCNKIYYLYDKTTWRPNYYCILDIDYIYRYQDEIFKNIDTTIFTNDVVAKNIKKENKRDKKIVYAKQIIYSDFKAYPNLMNYTYATKQGTIMSFCMAVAMYMGFKEIYILGMDNNSTTSGNHFVGYKEDESLTDNLEKRIKQNGWDKNHWKSQTEYEMNEFRKYADTHGISITNVTRGGCLEIFNRQKLEEVVNAKKNNN